MVGVGTVPPAIVFGKLGQALYFHVKHVANDIFVSPFIT